MQVIFLRHGTRNHGIGDIPLNSEGLEEARTLALSKSLLSASTIWSSPKKRAVMTVTPLAEVLDQKIEIHQDLDQQENSESQDDFQQRVDQVLQRISAMSGPKTSLVLCSHSDWLSVAAQRIPTSELHPQSLFFHCAHFKIFQIQDGIWHLN